MSLLMVRCQERRWSTALCRSSTASPRTIIERPRWSTTRVRSAPRRISSESRRGSRLQLKALPAGLGLTSSRPSGSKVSRRSRAPPPPRRGVGCQFVSSVARSLCPTFFSCASPREPHYIAPHLVSCPHCELCVDLLCVQQG